MILTLCLSDTPQSAEPFNIDTFPTFLLNSCDNCIFTSKVKLPPKLVPRKKRAETEVKYDSFKTRREMLTNLFERKCTVLISGIIYFYSWRSKLRNFINKTVQCLMKG